VIVCALFLRAPPQGWLPHEWKNAPRGEEVKKRQSAIEFTSFQMAATSQFWVMYFMMALVATGGLMATAQLAPIAKDFGVDTQPVTIGWITLAALPFALSLDRILNGVTRPFWGWVSDHIGREPTMTLAFGLEAGAIILLLSTATNPLLFVIFTGLTFFGWGEIYSLFPATSGDFFGRAYATTNYGLLYTAKGTASLLVPLGNVIQDATGSWLPVFAVAIVFDLTAAILAITALRALGRAHIERSVVTVEPTATLTPAAA